MLAKEEKNYVSHILNNKYYLTNGVSPLQNSLLLESQIKMAVIWHLLIPCLIGGLKKEFIK
jgi:hypothetical protein